MEANKQTFVVGKYALGTIYETEDQSGPFGLGVVDLDNKSVVCMIDVSEKGKTSAAFAEDNKSEELPAVKTLINLVHYATKAMDEAMDKAEATNEIASS